MKHSSNFDRYFIWGHLILNQRRRTANGGRPSLFLQQHCQLHLAVRNANPLPGRDIKAIPEVGCGDASDQSGQSLLIVMPGSLVIDLVRHRVCSVTESGSRFAERQGSAFGVGEVRRFTQAATAKSLSVVSPPPWHCANEVQRRHCLH